jgi:hypothetical protein
MAKEEGRRCGCTSCQGPVHVEHSIIDTKAHCGTDGSQTHRWREMDSNFQYAGAVNLVVALLGGLSSAIECGPGEALLGLPFGPVWVMFRLVAERKVVPCLKPTPRTFAGTLSNGRDPPIAIGRVGSQSSFR